jgi:hypothetical protein
MMQDFPYSSATPPFEPMPRTVVILGLPNGDGTIKPNLKQIAD